MNPRVQAYSGTWPEAVRDGLLQLRELIFETARATPGVGTLEETIKWGEPAYLTSETKSGTTIRLGRVRGQPSQFAMFVNCKTTLVATYRSLFADRLSFDGDRAIVFTAGSAIPHEEVAECIRLALTYKRTPDR